MAQNGEIVVNKAQRVRPYPYGTTNLAAIHSDDENELT